MNEELWAIYVPGPDEYHAMPSRDAAELAAHQHNNSGCIEHIAEQFGMERGVLRVSDDAPVESFRVSGAWEPIYWVQQTSDGDQHAD